MVRVASRLAPPRLGSSSLGSGPAPVGTAPHLWTGDFETGSLSQWEVRQQAVPGRISVVRSAAAQGGYAGRFEARQGEYTGRDSTVNRSELAVSRYPDGSRDNEGDERWYRWQTKLPADFPEVSGRNFATIMQWMRDDNRDPRPLSFGIVGRSLRIASGGTRYLGPISRGEWHEFLVHAKWSSDPRVGFIEVFQDGRLILPKLHLQNAYKDSSGRPIRHYIKQGLYKSDAVPSAHLFHDGMTVANSRAAAER